MNGLSGVFMRVAKAVAVAGLGGAVLSSCAMNARLEEERKAALAAAQLPPPLYQWDDSVVATGPTTVRIELAEQKAYISRGGQQQAWTYVATGRGRHPTPTGTFRVMEKTAVKSSNRYGVIVNSSGGVVDRDARAGREAIPSGGRFVGAPMPYWMRLTGYGIGMHAGPIPNPGYPASHGCIRLPRELAEKLFAIVDVGTQVTIRGSAPRS